MSAYAGSQSLVQDSLSWWFCQQPDPCMGHREEYISTVQCKGDCPFLTMGYNGLGTYNQEKYCQFVT